MFNRKKVKDLEYRVKFLEEQLQEIKKKCAPAIYQYQGLSLQDLFDDFRRTHVRVECSPHWISTPKKETPGANPANE